MSARDAVLARVRAALGTPGEPGEVQRGYRLAGAPGGATDVAGRFAERVAEYRATVHRVGPGDLETLLEELLGGLRVVAAPAFSGALDGAVESDLPPLSNLELDLCEAVLTGCALAIAETGTIVLDGGPESGRRAITLIPDHHVCVVAAKQVVAGVPEAVAALAPAVSRGMPLTWVSGPSATSDIELQRVEGVHGPRRLEVVLLDS